MHSASFRERKTHHQRQVNFFSHKYQLTSNKACQYSCTKQTILYIFFGSKRKTLFPCVLYTWTITPDYTQVRLNSIVIYKENKCVFGGSAFPAIWDQLTGKQFIENGRSGIQEKQKYECESQREREKEMTFELEKDRKGTGDKYKKNRFVKGCEEKYSENREELDAKTHKYRRKKMKYMISLFSLHLSHKHSSSLKSISFT